MAKTPNIVFHITGNITGNATSVMNWTIGDRPADPNYVFIEDADIHVEAYETTRYRCPFCRKTWAKQSTCYGHIQAGCHKDPRSATCATCKFLMDDDNGHWDSNPGCALGCGRFAHRRVDRPRNCPLWQPKGKT